ncbi:hypothetical protein F5B22DRAFT_251070 [Xylaria bambusicola]|uniref:uncharacterized protein n=1 Tax=Xylaria bambusicola TaxID=326684 RepID=UPI002007EA8B|nr:uncharacterized protein F5B22DRAFT_251070 [Xylaria bambusicola]KAI0525743.1 hypothetical protein F5B22DRAFT_251070 [Xylaria bambusicola]
MTSKHICKIEVIPWDHSSPDHVQRMHDQRVACGWRADEVPEWIESAKRGGKMFYWAVLAEDVPNRNELLAQHIATQPKEAEPLRDTAQEVRLAKREPTGRDFLPVGHVALDVHDPEEDAKLGLPAGTVWVHQLFISNALQGGGYGAATMAKVESIAAQEPMNGKWMALDTLAKEVPAEMGSMTIDVGMGNIVPVTSKEEWYARQGYETYRQGHGYTYQAPDGRNIQLRVSYMKKRINGEDTKCATPGLSNT